MKRFLSLSAFFLAAALTTPAFADLGSRAAADIDDFQIILTDNNLSDGVDPSLVFNSSMYATTVSSKDGGNDLSGNNLAVVQASPFTSVVATTGHNSSGSQAIILGDALNGHAQLIVTADAYNNNVDENGNTYYDYENGGFISKSSSAQNGFAPGLGQAAYSFTLSANTSATFTGIVNLMADAEDPNYVSYATLILGTPYGGVYHQLRSGGTVPTGEKYYSTQFSYTFTNSSDVAIEESLQFGLSALAVQDTSGWHGTGGPGNPTSAVPEPAQGLLMLLGIGALALLGKRRMQH